MAARHLFHHACYWREPSNHVCFDIIQTGNVDVVDRTRTGLGEGILEIVADFCFVRKFHHLVDETHVLYAIENAECFVNVVDA